MLPRVTLAGKGEVPGSVQPRPHRRMPPAPAIAWRDVRRGSGAGPNHQPIWTFASARVSRPVNPSNVRSWKNLSRPPLAPLPVPRSCPMLLSTRSSVLRRTLVRVCSCVLELVSSARDLWAYSGGMPAGSTPPLGRDRGGMFLGYPAYADRPADGSTCSRCSSTDRMSAFPPRGSKEVINERLDCARVFNGLPSKAFKGFKAFIPPRI